MAKTLAPSDVLALVTQTIESGTMSPEFILGIGKALAAEHGGVVQLSSDGNLTVRGDSRTPRTGSVWSRFDRNNPLFSIKDASLLDFHTTTFRTGGPWASVENGVRVLHIPTGVQVECSSSRSMHSNKAECWELLALNPKVAPFLKQLKART